MGLIDLFNDWIVERGSSLVQEKHIALFRDQLAIAEQKMSLLELENSVLKAENENLKSDLKKSKEKIEKLNHGPNLSLKYGVYWDKDGNSYCPNCKSPTSQIGWATYINRQIKALKCTCNNRPILLMDKGDPIHADEAMKIVAKSQK